jgi:arginine/lysine/ornithine decarboxylase
MDAGADLCVTSVHKMGNGLEQGSVYHLQGDRVSPAVLTARSDLLNTTSPNALIYAGLDGWRRQMVEHGEELLTRALDLAREARSALAAIPGIQVLDSKDLVGPDRAFDHDPLKILLDLHELGRAGYQANEWLRANERVDVGMSDHRRMAVQITTADDDWTVSRMVQAIQSLVEHIDEVPPAKPIHLPEPGELELEQVALPRDAFFGPAEQVPADDAPGRVCAETISPYPPGVPALLPGEIISKTVVEYLRTGLAAGMYIPDAADKELNTIRVVA